MRFLDFIVDLFVFLVIEITIQLQLHFKPAAVIVAARYLIDIILSFVKSLAIVMITPSLSLFYL